MRRIDRAVSDTEARTLLAAAEYGVLSMTSTDGEPYGIPLNFALEGDYLYFHCALEGRKIDLLTRNPRVSICAVGKTELIPSAFSTKYESVIATGSAEMVEGDEKRKGLVLLVEKYSPQYVAEGKAYIEKLFDATEVFRIRIDGVTGKARR